MKIITLLFVFLFSFNVTMLNSQVTASELLDKSIQYHDPANQWNTQSIIMNLQGSRPDGSLDTSAVYINILESDFKLEEERKGKKKFYQVKNDQCFLKLNDSEEISEADAKEHRMTCEMAKRIRNYYTYLWGMPMKLKDPGTIIDPKVEEEIFEGISCYKMKVSYEEGVGKDIWYFYFKMDDFSLHGYKFYHEESKNDGEYITLEGEEDVLKMKIPKIRKWYYNKDDKYLGTDTLLK